MSHEAPVSTPPAAPPAMPSLADLLAAQLPASTPQLPPAAPPLPAAAEPPGRSAPADAAADTRLEGLRVPLLLVHAGFSEGALIQTWMQHVMKGSSLYHAGFQEAVTDLVLDHQPYAVLIQFDPCCVDAAVALSAQLQQHYPQIPRLAIGRTRHAQCMLAALRTGVQDFLDIDGSVDTAQQVVRQLLASPPSTGLHASRAPQTAIVSARAGLGCSLLAAHLSLHLQARLQAPAQAAGAPLAAPDGLAGTAQEALSSLLIELGQPGGDCSIYLDTPGEFGFADAVRQQRRLDRRMALSAIARHASGLRLLTMTRPLQDSASSEVQALLNRLGHYFRHIVLDLGGCASPQVLQDVLPGATEIWVTCDQSVASVVGTAELLRQLELLQVPRTRLRLVVARHDPRVELGAQQIARQLQLPLLAQVPERRRELAEVVNQGQLFAVQHRREPYVQSIAKLVDHLMAEHHSELAPPRAAPANPLAQMLQRLRNRAP